MKLPDRAIRYLQDWYLGHCDGEWEHRFGINIGTLDNPGWRLAVDLAGTELEGRTLERQIVERSDHDWWQAWSDGSAFHVAAGPGNLGDALRAFESFVERGSVK